MHIKVLIFLSARNKTEIFFSINYQATFTFTVFYFYLTALFVTILEVVLQEETLANDTVIMAWE